MKMLVVSDLDGTAIFSKRALAGQSTDGLVPVDVDGSEIHAYMSRRSIRAWTRLAEAGVIVPVTTRTAKQYLRVALPGPAPKYAVVANGGRLLVEGKADKLWDRTVRERLARSGAPFEQVWERVSSWADTGKFRKVRAVSDLFGYVVAAERDGWLDAFAAEQAGWAAELGWRASLQGRKLYIVPTALDKAIAVRDLAERLGAVTVVAGGDSLLDRGMLQAADAAVRPAHGELHALGWKAPHLRVTAGKGAIAGEEILAWYVQQAFPAA